MWEDGFCNVDQRRSTVPMYAQCMNMSHHNHANINTNFSNNFSNNISNNISNNNGGFNVGASADPGDQELPVWRSFRKMSIQLYNYGEGYST
jgi:hypothetical protein